MGAVVAGGYGHEMFDLATAAVEGALGAGATYADARGVLSTTEYLHARNGELDGLRRSESVGVGVRALIGSSWGFFATCELGGPAARRAGEEAAAIARASAIVPGPPLELADVPVTDDHWESGWAEHPASVSLAEKGDLLVGATATMAGVTGVSLAEASMTSWETEKWFVSSQGHRISQHLVECGSAMSATAPGEQETQRRSWGGIGGRFGTRGYELVREADLGGNAQRVAEEAVALLTAPPVPRGSPTSSSAPSSWGCRSTSRWATPSSSTASSAGRRRSRAPPSSTWPSWAASATARSS